VFVRAAGKRSAPQAAAVPSPKGNP
jgi:hypothetical protein